MMIEIQNKHNLSLGYLRLKKIMNAQKIISLYKQTDSEVQLDEFFKKNYNIPLKLLCYTIVSSIKLTATDQNEVFINFATPQLEKLARVITYGTGKVPGSRILVDALVA